ncbi:MAG: CapA family protein [Clostridia bacterium]|nr:CapA family protein [Clostridia bacterium]
MKNGHKHGISSGTIVFLCLTVVVVAVTVFFLLAISGNDLSVWRGQMTGQVLLEVETVTPEPDIPVLDEQPAESTEPVQQNQEPVINLEPRALSLRFGGDIMVSKMVRETAEQPNGEYDFTKVFTNLNAAFIGADVSVATLETMTDDEQPYDTYNAPSAILDVLKQIGIYDLSLATEHMMDFGPEGLQMTRAALNSRGISYCGAYEAGSPANYQLFSANGINVAVLAYTYGIGNEGREKIKDTELNQLPLFSLERAVADIAAARANGANLVIVLPHWGTKNKSDISESMKETAAQLARAGADMIIGAHSNIASGLEMLRAERADGRVYETLVCYSLGALLMDARSEDNAAGMVLSVEIEYDPSVRQIHYRNIHAIPLYIYQDIDEGIRVWRVINTEIGDDLNQLTADIREGALAAKQKIEQLSAGLGGI